MMEEEDDDLYAPEDSLAKAAPSMSADVKNEEMEDAEEEDEDSDSDIDIIVEKKDGTVEPPQSRRRVPQNEPTKTITERPSQTPALSKSPGIPTRVAAPSKSGAGYPEVRTSTVDLEANPIYQPIGKPITEVDIDADLAEHTKPWRLPGADQSDYFNYGFDEFTWTMYCMRQKSMKENLSAQKEESSNFQKMLAGGGMPGMPPLPGMPGADSNGMAGTGGAGAGSGGDNAAQQMSGGGGGGGATGPGGGMPPMPGMPNMSPEMMNEMMTEMMAQGITDPSQLDFGTFMNKFQQMQQAGAGGGGMQGAPQGPSGFGGGGGQGGGQMGYGGGGGGGGYGGGGGGGGGGYGRGRGGRRW